MKTRKLTVRLTEEELKLLDEAAEKVFQYFGKKQTRSEAVRTAIKLYHTIMTKNFDGSFGGKSVEEKDQPD